MVIEEVNNLFQHGRFEEAIDIIDEIVFDLDPTDERYQEMTAIKSRLYYHQGRVDQALYWIKQITKDNAGNIKWELYKIIYQFGMGELGSARQSLINLDNIMEQEVTPESIPTMSYFYYAKGLFAEFDGEIEAAKQYFEKSLEYRQTLNDQFESNIILYKLATISRMQGHLEQAKQYLERSLQISQSLDLTKEIATTITLLGQDELMATNYDKAIPLLEKGVDKWKQAGTPFGIIWALGELAIVNYLNGAGKQALQQYQEIIDRAESVMPAQYLSAHYLKLIRFALGENKLTLATDLTSELETIAASENNGVIDDRLNLIQSLLKIHQSRLSIKFSEKENLKELQNVEEVEVKLIGLITDIQLLLLEFKLTTQELFRSDILDEAEEKIEQLLDHIRMKSNITFEIHTALLRSQIEILRYNPIKALDLLQSIDKFEDEQLKLFYKDLQAIENDIDHLLWSEKSFDFDKEFHSIPTMKILLYLLPRNWVSFSDLQDATNLSAGHLSGKTSTLEEKGFIYKNKQFINQKSTTVFSLSPEGFIQFNRYLQKLGEMLQNKTI